MLAVYRAVLWMPFLTALAAVGCVVWLIWSIDTGTWLAALPSGFGIFTFSMVSVIGFYVRKKMIQVELIAKEKAFQLAQQVAVKTAKAVDDHFIAQLSTAANPHAPRAGQEWRNEHTTTSQSS